MAAKLAASEQVNKAITMMAEGTQQNAARPHVA